jgi:SAM-dependent methyltransferase
VTVYTPEFYRNCSAGSASSAAVVVPYLAKLLKPSSVLDVGCGTGLWLAEWERTGAEVAGVDGPWVQRDRLKIPRETFTAHDLSEPLNLQRRFEVVTCLEVAEHLTVKAGHRLIDGLCRHGDVIVFSAAVPGQGGTNHINLHWPSYWAKLFAKHGYKPYDVLRDHFWWDQRVEWWYRQNLLIFADPAAAAKLGLETPDRSLDLAQPALLMPELAPRLDATICVPWRPTPSRLKPFERMKAFWSAFGWPIITADSDTEIFSLAQARNAAVRAATTDVVIICDADTLIDPINVVRAVADPGGVCWPFTRYRILSRKYLRTPLADLPTVPHINTWDGEGTLGVGGCIITTRREYARLGGSPPEFIGWGWEDTSFTAVVATLSQVKRITGNAYAFEHNERARRYVGAKADSPGWDRDIGRNEELYRIYRTAAGRPWLMREVLKQRAADNPDDPLNWGRYFGDGANAATRAR